MNSFNIGSKELASTHHSVEVLTTAANGGLSELDVSIDVLHEVQLSQYFVLCELVDRAPNIVDFYVSALQRVQITKYAVDKALEVAGDSTELIELVHTQDSELVDLEAFFELFKPEHPSYVAYLGRLGLRSEDATDTTIEPPESDVEGPDLRADLTDRGTTPEQVAGDVVASDKDKTDKQPTTKKTTEVVSESDDYIPQILKIDLDKINLTVADLETNETEDDVLALILSTINTNDWFKSNILDFISLGIDEKKAVAAFRTLIQTLLQERILLRHGRTRGTKYRIADEYTVKTSGDTAQVATEKAHTTTTVEPTVKTTKVASKPKKPKIASAGEIPDLERKIDSKNNLTVGGIRLDGSIKPYQGRQYEIIKVLCDSPRKEPVSVGQITQILNLTAESPVKVEEVEAELMGLQTMLPGGWIFPVRQSDGNPVAWRLGSGINIKSNRIQPKKKK